MPPSGPSKNRATGRYHDLLAIGAILLYCLAYASTRLLISRTMELDEAEQFLDGAVLSLGYGKHAPLYSWIVNVASLPFGMNIVTLLAVKYCLLASFYLGFYLVARTFWDSTRALLVTGSLLLFPIYSYEANRDMTHTILVTVMAVMTCYFYIRILREGRTVHYLLMGIFIGLGILSKYNFGFFLAALVLSSLVSREGRRVIADKRIFLSLACGVLVLSPHVVWLIQKNFPSLQYALSRSRAGELGLGSPVRVISRVGLSSSLEVLPFFLVSAIIFRRHLSIHENRGNQVLLLFRGLAFFGLMTPWCTILLLRTGEFSGRWLAPVLFTLPLALFSMVAMKGNQGESRLFASLCIGIAVGILAVRAFIGFFPDRAGRVDRLHIPYGRLSQQLIEKLGTNGMGDPRGLAVIADASDAHIAANIIAHFPGARFVLLRNFTTDSVLQKDVLDHGGILVYDILRRGGNFPEKFIAAFPWPLPLDTLQSPYIHSAKFPPFVLGVAIIPKREIRQP